MFFFFFLGQNVPHCVTVFICNPYTKALPCFHNLSASTQLMEALPCNWDLVSLWGNNPKQMALIINTGELNPSISAHSSGLGCCQCISEWLGERRYPIPEFNGLCCIEGTRPQQTHETFKIWNSFHWGDIYNDMENLLIYINHPFQGNSDTAITWSKLLVQNMGESQKHCTRRMKPGIREYIW